MTPGGCPNFNSYVKILRVLVFITDGRTDRWMDRQRNESSVGWVPYWFLQVKKRDSSPTTHNNKQHNTLVTWEGGRSNDGR